MLFTIVSVIKPITCNTTYVVQIALMCCKNAFITVIFKNCLTQNCSYFFRGRTFSLNFLPSNDRARTKPYKNTASGQIKYFTFLLLVVFQLEIELKVTISLLNHLTMS